MQRFLSVLPAFLLLFPAFSLYAQTSNPDEIVVIGSAMLDLPADRILVRISLEYSDKVDGKSAFEQHQAAETTLVALLRSYKFPDSLITYSLIGMSPQMQYAGGVTTRIFKTNAQVSVLLTDLSRYPQLLVDLVQHGFVSFSEEFQSSKAKDAEKMVIEEAVQQANSKAEIIAHASGRSIARVMKIADTEETEPVIARYYEPRPYREMSISAQVAGSLPGIPQKITVNKQVKVTFALGR